MNTRAHGACRAGDMMGDQVIQNLQGCGQVNRRGLQHLTKMTVLKCNPSLDYWLSPGINRGKYPIKLPIN